MATYTFRALASFLLLSAACLLAISSSASAHTLEEFLASSAHAQKQQFQTSAASLTKGVDGETSSTGSAATITRGTGVSADSTVAALAPRQARKLARKPVRPTPAPTTPLPTATPTAPTPAPTSGCTVAPIPLVAGDWRAEMLNLVNQARAANGVSPVCYNEKLNSASQAQSLSGVYGHTWNFITATCYNWNTLGQNIAMGFPTVQSVFDAWFNEVAPNDGHRKNILNPNFRQMGNGWTTSNNLWTQNFGNSATEPCYYAA